MKLSKVFFLLTSSLFLLVSTVFAQDVVFSDPNMISGGCSTRAYCVYNADIDGDGDLDIISASYTHNKIAWYENIDGLGNFGSQSIIYSDQDDGAVIVHAADLDGDGDMDVLSTSNRNDRVTWFENLDGLGNFGTIQYISTNLPHPYGLQTADVDGDSDIDVIAISEIDGKVVWFENLEGLGVFGTENLITDDAGGAHSVFSADFDGDGDIDVVAASYDDDKIEWYENTDGLGNFGQPQIIVNDEDAARSVYASDLDNDGDMDVLSASYSGNTIAWYENTDGQGTFGPQQVIMTVSGGGYVVHSADVDGDGDYDVLSGSGDDIVAWYENTDGLGSFGAQQIIEPEAGHAYSLNCADFDGDGDIDLAVALEEDHIVAMYKNDGLGSFSEQIPISPNTLAPVCVCAADLDNDGDKDILSVSSEGKYAWYENMDGLGDLGYQRIITTQTREPKFVHCADFDGDSDLDVLSASSRDNKIAWYENLDGLGNFGEQQIITTDANRPRCAKSADLDGDGDEDVVTVSAFDDKVAWHENTDGSGTFGPQQIISTSQDVPVSLDLADIDGDGDIDIVTASLSDGIIAWYENTDGLGNFGEFQQITDNTQEPRFIYCADIDGDEDMDVLSASYEDNKIAWYENEDGLGGFGTQQVISVNVENANGVYAADIDFDGDMDVLSSSNFAGAAQDTKIAWFENLDGAGSFGTQQSILSSSYSTSFVFADDVNGDSLMDVLYTSATEDIVAWFCNETTISVPNIDDISPLSYELMPVYPNPFNSSTKIKYNLEKPGRVNFRMYNMLGQQVWSLEQIKQSAGQYTIHFSQPELSSGMYIISMEANQFTFTQKVILIK